MIFLQVLIIILFFSKIGNALNVLIGNTGAEVRSSFGQSSSALCIYKYVIFFFELRFFIKISGGHKINKKMN